LWIERDRPAAPALVGVFRRAVARRAAGAPLAYATGRAAFRTLELAADRRALIPRPETEGLVELVLRWVAAAPGGVAADIGTGTGCIALALAMESQFERVIATDCSGEAAALARENVARVRPGVPVEVRVGNLLAPLAAERCRVIVANPPYLTEEEWAALDPAVREFEPKAALASGPDGLAATRALLGEARTVLEPGGLLALEIDERRSAVVQALAHDAGWNHVSIHQDLFGRPRYALAV
jgi:release factor glutamine methyltransferase